MAAAIRDSGGNRAALRGLRHGRRIPAAMLPPETGSRRAGRMFLPPCRRRIRPGRGATAQVVYNTVMNNEQAMPSNEERLLATLAHASIILNGFNLIGIIGAIAILVSQRQRSEFVRRHAIQALAFQLAGLVATMLLLGTWMACLLISLIPALLRPELYSEGPPMPFWLALGAILLLLLFVLIGIAYGCTGALAAWRGQAFRYLFIGPLVERYTGTDTAWPGIEASPRPDSQSADREWLGG